MNTRMSNSKVTSGVMKLMDHSVGLSSDLTSHFSCGKSSQINVMTTYYYLRVGNLFHFTIP